MPSEFNKGDRSICESCGYSIEYNGRHWEHLYYTPKHPSVPTILNTKPEVMELLERARRILKIHMLEDPKVKYLIRDISILIEEKDGNDSIDNDVYVDIVDEKETTTQND